MNDDISQPQPARRGFLKQMVSATAALPLVGGAAAVVAEALRVGDDIASYVERPRML